MALTQPLRAWQLADVRNLTLGVLALTSILAIFVCVPGVAHAQFDTDPMRESASLDAFPHRVVLVDEGLPDGVAPEEIVGGIRHAIDTWNEVGCSAAMLQWGGLREDPTSFERSVTPIVFANPDTQRCFAAQTNIGWTVINACCDERPVDDECPGREYPPYTIFLNTRDFDWSAKPAPYQTEPRLRVDVRSVVTHELGHVLGLGHTDDDTLATMAPRYLRDGGLATLAASDKEGVCLRYPQEVDECETDAGCPDLGPCVEVDEWKVCDEYRGSVGSHCALDRLICPGECFLSSPVTYSGYCTTACSSDDECPDDFVCDTDEGSCRLEVRLRESAGGCATATGGRTDLWVLMFGLVVGFTSRRRW